MEDLVENCPANYVYNSKYNKCQGPCPDDMKRVGNMCEKNGKLRPMPNKFMSAQQLEEWKKNQTPLEAAINVMLATKNSHDVAVMEYSKNMTETNKLKTIELKNKFDITKRYVLAEMSKTVIPLPPDEWANWQASLEFDMNKPGDFNGKANPYYTNYTFLRTLTRIPLMEADFIKASNFVKGPVWPLTPRIGKYNHTKNEDFLTIANEIRNVSHEF